MKSMSCNSTEDRLKVRSRCFDAKAALLKRDLD